jgi:hypothetical protein
MLERTVRLEFSAWVPRPVRAAASQMWKITEEREPILTDECKAEIQETILRLANDPRMRTVWNWLGRTRKNVQINLGAASQLWWKGFHEAPHLGWTANEIALAGFFFEACRSAISLLLVPPAARRWLATLRRSVSDLEQKPRQERLSLPTPGDPHALLVDLEDAPELRDPVRTRARMYVTRLKATTKLLYGQPMHSALATVANVALEIKAPQQISRDHARNLPG